VEVVASLSQGRTAAAQCGLFTHKSVPVIFEPSCIFRDNEERQRKLSNETKSLLTVCFIVRIATQRDVFD